MNRWLKRWLLCISMALAAPALLAQTRSSDTAAEVLPRTRYRSGETILRAFSPVSQATRQSIVKFNVNGTTVALGVLMDTNGLALTKASELKAGKLTCWLATEEEVPAKVVATDPDEDVALVQVQVSAAGLKPLRWAPGTAAIGQWAITPGIAETPHAVGIISALPHRVRGQRAYAGIQFDFSTSLPRVDSVISGFGAEKAGIQPRDVITAVNGIQVTNRDGVVESLRDYRAGQTVWLTVERAGKRVEAEVVLKAPTPELDGGFYSFETQRRNRLSGEVSERAEGFEQVIEHDTVLQPWLCGGPLVNLDGLGLGLNIARAERVATYALPTSLVTHLYERLKSQSNSRPAVPAEKTDAVKKDVGRHP